MFIPFSIFFFPQKGKSLFLYLVFYYYLFAVFGFRSELLIFFFFFFFNFLVCVWFFNVRCLILECVNVVRIECVFFFFLHVSICKNLGFCGVLVMVKVVIAGFWWLGWVSMVGGCWLWSIAGGSVDCWLWIWWTLREVEIEVSCLYYISIILWD